MRTLQEPSNVLEETGLLRLRNVSACKLTVRGDDLQLLLQLH
jgi:hypothetical protein